MTVSFYYNYATTRMHCVAWSNGGRVSLYWNIKADVGQFAQTPFGVSECYFLLFYEEGEFLLI